MVIMDEPKNNIKLRIKFKSSKIYCKNIIKILLL